MKIQVSRLHKVLQASTAGDEAHSILGELREGLNGAYRELRELLTTFRLKIEGNGLLPTLEKTVQEFSARGNIPISIDSQLGSCQLSANEEIHIMQIVREALANVLHHSRATQAGVSVAYQTDNRIAVTISDNGIGVKTQQAETHHYGMSIMQERSRSLGGTFKVQSPAGGGTQVSFYFEPGSRHSLYPQGSLAA
jgi:two-component system nitrate/nitrite sensor histidine kinase NarX